MNSRIRFLICSVLIPLIFILGLFCLTQSSYNHPLVGHLSHPFSREGIFITAKAYSSRESVHYLHRDLTSYGIQPIQVTIQNNTDRTYLISEKGVQTPHASVNKVSFSILRSSIPRSIGLKVATLFFWPFIIPSALDTLMTLRTHSHINHEYTIKGFKDEPEVLMPYSTVNRILFVPKELLQTELVLALYDKQAHCSKVFQASIG